MSRVASSIIAAMIGLGAAGLGAVSAQAADLSVSSDYPGICGNASVLNRITSRFSYQVRHVPNLPQVGITDFQRIHEHRYLPADESHPIGRRYCGATVTLSDGGDRDIWYLIEEGMGFASIGDNVEFCVSGFDRWYVYNGRCRVLR
ncbi:hypothetical protein CO731_04190 [Aminobacter sp. MSH1]|uniref:hypothetical protein n=1 Tax=Aminobacter sp. MSH1 TaxID=374606 RepID=UPI000D3C1177|nr:hypothetical protein [Aminobacter sp. MSH1]AWC24699.1 hypothetical protein CO731_04190 [Aminobacter sp. MSH1]